MKTRCVWTALLVVAMLASCGMPGADPAMDPAAIPEFSPVPGTYDSDQFVTLSCSTADATIYYTTDGTMPTELSDNYVDPIPVEGQGTEITITAMAVAAGHSQSPSADATYLVVYPAPTVSIPAITTVNLGQVPSFTAVVDGEATYSYRWEISYDFFSWSDLGGQTSLTYSMSAANIYTDGRWVRCTAYDSYGSGTSDPGIVKVNLEAGSPSFDTDGDGIDDYHEFEDLDSDGYAAEHDTDFDSLYNYMDIDDDGDGIPTVTEVNATQPYDFDGDGTPNHLDDDSDLDGVPDYIEGWDADSDGMRDVSPTGSDTDSDGLDNAFDSNQGGVDPPLQDTDSDGYPDYLDVDDDGDGVDTLTEGTGDTDGDGVPDYLDPE